jgi:hypothetical protein
MILQGTEIHGGQIIVFFEDHICQRGGTPGLSVPEHSDGVALHEFGQDHDDRGNKHDGDHGFHHAEPALGLPKYTISPNHNLSLNLALFYAMSILGALS